MTKSLKIIFILLLLFVGKMEGVWGQSSKPVLGPDMPRTALVGPDCMFTSFIQTIDVVEGKANIDNLLDTDLTNSMTIAGVAGVDLLDNPVLQVKDRKKYYAAGTKAGFCMESSGGLLSLDLINVTYITFYRDGKNVGSVKVDDGDDIDVLGLSLLQLPGEDAITYLTASAPDKFDEIALEIKGVVDADVLSTPFKIRYAFVGNAQETVLHDGLSEDGLTSMKQDIGVFGFTIPLIVFEDKINFIDNDKSTCATAKTVLSVSLLKGGIEAGISWKGKKIPSGTEVGFVLEDLSVLNIGVAKGLTIIVKNDTDKKEIPLNIEVVGLGLIQEKKMRVSAIAPIDFTEAKLQINFGAVGLKLGEVRKFYYGYICEPTQVPEICDLGLSMDATICESETQYQLKSTQPVTWSIDSKPNEDTTVKVDEETGLVSDMAPNVTGEYVFRGTSKDNTDCSQYVILKRGIEKTDSQCNKPVTSDEGYELFVPGGTTGGVLPSDGLIDPDNIVDNSMDTYAEYIDGLSLLSVQSIVGVKNENGNISDGITSKRIGFTIEMPWQALDLTLLKTFQIRAYNNNSDDPVYSSLIERSNVLSLGLIGSEKSAKVRFSIEVPSNISFDRFALWNLGLLNLNISTLRIYGAFVEEVDLDCDDPLGCDAIISGGDELSSATLNYAGTYITGVNVFSGLVNMENLIDGNIDTYATLAVTVGVLNHSSVAINFGRIMNSTHQVGFVLDENTMLGNVDLLKFVTIETYLNGVSTGDSKMDWNVLGADVIGYGDKAYLMMTPTKEYDEVRMKLEGVLNLNLLKPEINIYGVFVRNDADGDGIPDCMDPDSCTGDLTGLAVTKDVCVGDNILLSAIANFKNVDSKDYTLTVSDGTIDIYTENITIENGIFEHYFNLEKAGQYTLTLTEVLGEGDASSPNTYTLTFTVHPLETTWTPTSSSTDWNAWGNWSAGSPWTCTDVIIPTVASVYPVLESGVLNGCHYIHFEPNTEVVNTHRLTYEKAWVEMKLKPNCYYMVSMPLKGVYSGDLFLPRYKGEGGDNGHYPDYFKPLNEESLPANRVYPTVYQRIWNNTAVDKLLSGSSKPIGIATSQWTSPFNWLSTPYEKNGDYDFNALSIWVHPLDQATDEVGYAGDYDYIFRFPKEHTTYYYYDEKGKETNIWAQIKRDAKSIGRFIYENEEGKTEFPVKMVYKNEEASHYFLIGNPFMAHLDVAKLFEDNPHLKSIKIYDGTGANTVINPAEEGLLVTNREGDESTTIAPMQSFFVEVEDENVTSCEVTFTESVLTKAKEGSGWLKSDDRASASENVIRLNALVENMEAGASLYFSSKANDNYRRGEDSELLMDGDVKPDVAVFTALDGQALDIQQRVNGGEIPVGIYLLRPQEVTFSVVIPKGYDGWALVDGLENRVYPLLAGQRNEIPLGRMTTNVGRFYLRGASATSNQVITATQPKVTCYSEEGSGRLIVRSLGDVMTRCEVYSVGGNMSGMLMMETYEYSLPVSPGVAVVKVYFRDGISSVFKVFVNK